MVKMVLPFNHGDEAGVGIAPSAPPMDDFQGVDQINVASDYVDFLVLGDKENHLVRANRVAIEQSDSELRLIFSGGSPSIRLVDGKYTVPNVDKDAFGLFISYLETKFIKFPKDHQQTLQLFELACRFQCPPLQILCVQELDMYLSVESVLPIFRSLWLYKGVTPPVKAKDLRGRSRQKAKEAFHQPEEYFAALLVNCLQLIEMHAEQVFAQDEMTALSFKELEMIVTRDALQMSAETALFDLLVRWSRDECTRKKLDLTSENRRRVLGALCFTPRYLVLTPDEYKATRDRAELLDSLENQLVLDEFRRKKHSAITPEQEAMLESFKRHRPPFPLLPIWLSERSNPRKYPKKMRRYVEDLEKGKEPGSGRGCCGEGHLFNCICLLISIFD